VKTFVIVGTGQAGCSAAMALRGHGFDGRIVMVGAEPHLPYERPPLSKQLLRGDAGPLPLLQAPDMFVRQGIEVLAGKPVVRLHPQDGRVELIDGSSLPFDELLLATGGNARRLDVPGGCHALTLRTFDDALALRERLRHPGHLTIIGAGVIGLEVAATARGLGWSVTVLEFGDRPMARVVPPAIGHFIAEAHRAAGVELRFGASVQAIALGSARRYKVTTADVRLATDLVVAGVGMQPDVTLAGQAGVETADAILVDEMGRTNLPRVHAAGDAASFWHPLFARRMRLESWQHAARHAAVVARNMIAPTAPYDDVPWSWSDQYDLNLQTLGLPLEGDETVLRGSFDERKFVALHLRERRLVGATLLNMGREMRPCKALIESGAVLDASRLCDPALALRALAAELAPVRAAA